MRAIKVYGVVAFGLGLLAFALSWFVEMPDLRLLTVIVAIGVMLSASGLIRVSNYLAKAVAADSDRRQ
jgi:hypothetical protein